MMLILNQPLSCRIFSFATFLPNIYQNTMLDSCYHSSMVVFTSEVENSVYPNQLAYNMPSDLYLHCFKTGYILVLHGMG